MTIAKALDAGMTVPELSRLLRVSCDKIRLWIVRGELRALNTAGARTARPRYIVLPAHLAEFERSRSAAPPPKRARKRKRPPQVDYFPD